MFPLNFSLGKQALSTIEVHDSQLCHQRYGDLRFQALLFPKRRHMVQGFSFLNNEHKFCDDYLFRK